MPAPTTANEFRQLLELSGLVERAQLDQALVAIESLEGNPQSAMSLARSLVRQRLITSFHAEQLLAGRHKGFMVGKYKILKLLGTGGMGRVYLAEHRVMRRQVALKILPKRRANDPGAIARFHREARAVAALNHPNIVHAYDIDREGDLHFIVMECVEGMSIQEFVKAFGPIPWAQAADYIMQTADALEHANKAGLIHRDIKPGNLLVDKTGRVKLLDMGLAVFYGEKEGDPLTLTNDDNVLGTADYLAPEQAIDSHNVDTRADIYSLGGTFYYMLTGGPPFPNGTVTQKLLWHQGRSPRSIREINADVPEEVCAIVEKMMAKKPDERYQTPVEIQEALRPFARRLDVPFADSPDLLGVSGVWGPPTPPGASEDEGNLPPSPPAVREASPAGVIPRRRGSPDATAGSSVEETPAPKPRKTSDRTKSDSPKAPVGPPNRDGRQPAEKRHAPATPMPGKRLPAVRANAMSQAETSPVATEEIEEIPLLGTESHAPIAAAVADDFLTAIRQAAVSPGPRVVPDTAVASAAAQTRPEPIVRPRPRWWIAVAAALVCGLTSAAVWVIAPKFFDTPPTAVATPSPEDAAKTEEPKPRQVLIPSVNARDVIEGLYIAMKGETVLLKEPGPWRTPPLRVNTLYIDGKEGVTLAAESPNTVVQLTNGSDGPLLLIENTMDFVVRNLILDGNGAQGPVIEIGGPHVAGVSIEGCTIRNFRGDAIRIRNADGNVNQRVTLKDVTVLHTTAGGSSVVFAPPAEATDGVSRNVELIGCRFQGPFQAGVTLAQGVEPLTMRNTTFSGGRVGLRLEAKNADWSKISLFRNVFENVPTRIESAVGAEAAAKIRVSDSDAKPSTKAAPGRALPSNKPIAALPEPKPPDKGDGKPTKK